MCSRELGTVSRALAGLTAEGRANRRALWAAILCLVFGVGFYFL